jgi:hypothetical protein
MQEIFKNSSRLLKFVGTKTVSWSKYLTEDYKHTI